VRSQLAERSEAVADGLLLEILVELRGLVVLDLREPDGVEFIEPKNGMRWTSRIRAIRFAPASRPEPRRTAKTGQ
jgi:hypothetical protein